MKSITVTVSEAKQAVSGFFGSKAIQNAWTIGAYFLQEQKPKNSRQKIALEIGISAEQFQNIKGRISEACAIAKEYPEGVPDGMTLADYRKAKKGTKAQSPKGILSHLDRFEEALETATEDELKASLERVFVLAAVLEELVNKPKVQESELVSA